MENKLLIKYSGVDVFQQDMPVLKSVDLEVYTGEFIYLLGKVGSGKSSLLKTLYAEIPVDTGLAGVLGYDLISIKNSDIPYLRRKIGIVFQDFQLLPDRTVYSNLEFVLRATGWRDKSSIAEQIDNVLGQVGMAGKAYKMPHQLSGGEQQRVVISRALLNSPEIILADEPTGNLDPETGQELVDLLYGICTSGTTVLMATHNLQWLKLFPGRILRFENEKVTEIVDPSVIDTVKINVIADDDSIVEETIVVDEKSATDTAGEE